MASFILSIVYNIIGLFFAVQGNLVPAGRGHTDAQQFLQHFLITFGSSNLLARQ